MKCPVCSDQVLTMSERQGVEIDYCPGCRGVWLDRGELDKLIEKTEAAMPSAPPAPSPRSDDRNQRDDDRNPRGDDRNPRGDDRYEKRYEERFDRSYDDRRPKKKKSSFLSEIMDF